jgi:transposase
LGEKEPRTGKQLMGFYVLETGCKWEDMPRRYGSYVTAWRRLKRWSEEGIWFKILCGICDTAYSTGNLSIDTVSVDSTLIDSKKAENFQVTTVKRRKGVKVHASVDSDPNTGKL